MPDEPIREPAPQPPSPADAAAKYQPALPRAVQAQVDALDAMMKEQQPPAQPEQDQPAGAEPPVGDDATAGEEPAGGEDVGEDTWEQRARSVAGRLEQAINANQQLSSRISELELQASTMRLYGKAPQPGTQPEPAPASVNLINEAERGDYGEEFFDVVGRRAKEVYAPEFDQLNKRLKQLEGQTAAVGEVMQKSQKRDLYSTLHEQVPDWKQINHHPDFKVWLSYPDPFSGIKRHDLLNDAFARHDTHRVVNFFTGFIAEATGLPPNPQSGTPTAPPLPSGQASGNGSGSAAPPLSSGQASGRPTLESFAAPGRARSGPQSLPPDKPVYTQAQIAKFSDDERRGLWRGRETDAAAIWQDIFRAQHEGRIQ
jgi:hypothetical protein